MNEISSRSFRFKYLLALFLFLLFAGCRHKANHTNDVRLITKDSDLIKNFNEVKMLADSMIIEIFDDQDALSYLIVSYDFEYQNWVKNSKDTLDEKPLMYWISYDLKLNNDTIYGGRIEIDSLKMIRSCWLHSFIGLKKLHDNELQIRKSHAKSIAQKNGLEIETLELEFKANKELPDLWLNHGAFKKLLKRTDFSKDVYFWDAANYCNGCSEIYINAKDGNIFERLKMTQCLD